jgi:hypothetical protein
MQAALAIPSCHNNPCKASAIHKDKVQLDAALFDPPFCSFAGKQWAAGRVAVRASCESASRSTFRAIPRAQAIPPAGSFPRKRQTSGAVMVGS